MIYFDEDKWGLVLNGGGGKGSYQIGVFKAFYEMGIADKFAGISGSSVGALNECLYCMDDQQISEKAWEKINPDSFLKINPDMIDMKEGCVSRDGLIKIIDEYVKLDNISENEKMLYASASEVVGEDSYKVRYFSLNYRDDEKIKKILLASSALPVLYEPVEIDGKFYKDGGITDNMPIAPLYAEGIRNFVVISMATDAKINTEGFPGAKFLLIKPSQSIGEFVDGTLDFSKNGSKIRQKIGYLDGMRELEFSDKDKSDPQVKILYEARKKDDYTKIQFELKQSELKKTVNSDMNALENLIKKWDI